MTPCSLLSHVLLLLSQRAKAKMVLEHLVVAKAAKSDKLAQQELDDIIRYGAKELFAEDDDDNTTEQHLTAVNGVAAPDAAAEHKLHNKRMRIVYDDAAIDRLLDRSQVAAAAAAAAREEAEGEDDEFTKAFKVTQLVNLLIGPQINVPLFLQHLLVHLQSVAV